MYAQSVYIRQVPNIFDCASWRQNSLNVVLWKTTTTTATKVVAIGDYKARGENASSPDEIVSKQVQVNVCLRSSHSMLLFVVAAKPEKAILYFVFYEDDEDMEAGEKAVIMSRCVWSHSLITLPLLIFHPFTLSLSFSFSLSVTLALSFWFAIVGR